MPNEFDAYNEWLGISPEDQPPNYYRLLGIKLFEPDLKVINDAASQRYLHVQSFQTRDNAALANRILKEIIIAGVCLLTPEKKAKYDSELKHECISVQQEPNDRLTVPMEFVESIKTSQIIKAQGANKYSQLWSAAVGILMLVGLIITVLAINKNLRDVTNPHANGLSSNHTASKPSDDSGKRKVSRQIIEETMPFKPLVAAEGQEKKESAYLPDLNPNIPMPNQPKVIPPQINPPVAQINLIRNVEVNLTLPTGARLTEAMLEVPEDWQDKLFPPNAIVYVDTYPNDKLKGVFTLNNRGKIHGAAAMLHETGHLQTLVFYNKGNLHGPMKKWNEMGERILYAEYKNDNKHGLLCLFKEGMPWLIQEYNIGKVQNDYLAQYKENNPHVVPHEKMSVEERSERDEAIVQLAALEETMQKNETILKNELAGWYRKKVEEERWNNFIEQAPDRRAAQSAITQGYSNRAKATNEMFWRNVLMNATPTGETFVPQHR